MDEIVGVKIKQEQDLQEISPEQDCLEILPEIIKTDLDIVKTEYQYCTNYDADCSNLPSENNGLYLKEEKASLGVTEENSVNKIDIDEHEVPTHVILKYKEDCDQNNFKQWVKEEQGLERRQDGLDENILVYQKLDLPKISPQAVIDLKTEIDLDKIEVKSENQFRINCVENSSDNLPSENALVSKDYLSAEENVELQSDAVKLKQVAKKKKGNRNETSVSKGRKHKCHYCDYETQYGPYLKVHVSAIHKKGNAKECALRDHLGVHKEKAPHECPGCGRGFNRKKHLDNHLLTHHDNLHHMITNKIHYCKFCTFKTIISINLIRHITCNHNRVQRDSAESAKCRTSAERFQCHKCNYIALQKGNLKTHLLIHSNTRPYLCTACTKGFCQKISLHSHILSKHKENADLLKSITYKIHQCTFCPHKTMNSRNFLIHMKSKHEFR